MSSPPLLRTKPTLKEWKLTDGVAVAPVDAQYEAYLEGMETLIFRMSLISSPKYEAYLEGMET